MSASGVILTIILAFGGSTNGDVTNNCVALFLKSVIFVSALMYMSTIISCILVLKPRKYKVINPSELDQYFIKNIQTLKQPSEDGNIDTEPVKLKLYKILSSYEKKNTEVVNTLSRWLNISTIFFAIASILSVLAVLIYLLNH